MNKIIFITLLLSQSLYAGFSKPLNKLGYRTSFGKCPSRSSGVFALKVVKEFEKLKSLKAVKELILSEKLKEKHFLSSYDVKFNPIKNKLNIKVDCPTPLMKVQIYKENGEESYEALLVEGGQLYDPTYEVILRSEKKLKNKLPYLAIPVSRLNDNLQIKMSEMFSSFPDSMIKKVSEIIINDVMEMTIILSVRGRPSSVFIGKEEWNDKLEKLSKIVRYMDERRQFPSIINLTNAKKVVVKFSHKN